MYVIKKDGTREDFNVEKVVNAVNKSAARILYKFTDEEIAAAAFKINVQSALKAGKIVPAAGASITLPAAAAGETAKLTADMITGYTYNNQP